MTAVAPPDRRCDSCNGPMSHKGPTARFCCETCRSRHHRGDDYVPTADDLATIARLVAEGLPPAPSDDERAARRVALGRARTPAFTGATVPEAAIEIGPGGDPAARLRALRARRLGL